MTARPTRSTRAGRRTEAGALFADAERMQRERQSHFEPLHSSAGHADSDWLLAPAERAAWLRILRGSSHAPAGTVAHDDHAKVCDEVERRGRRVLAPAGAPAPPLDAALGHLTLARVGLIRAILLNPFPQPTFTLPSVADALNGLRAAGHVQELPRGLLTAALDPFVRREHDLRRHHLPRVRGRLPQLGGAAGVAQAAGHVLAAACLPLGFVLLGRPYPYDLNLPRQYGRVGAGPVGATTKRLKQLGRPRRIARTTGASRLGYRWPQAVPPPPLFRLGIHELRHVRPAVEKIGST